ETVMRNSVHPRAAMAALGFSLILVVGVVPFAAAPAAAQNLPEPGDGFDWERVGDIGIDVFDLAFSADGTLWATGREGPQWLDTTGSFPGTWVLPVPLASAIKILPLGGDGPY